MQVAEWICQMPSTPAHHYETDSVLLRLGIPADAVSDHHFIRIGIILMDYHCFRGYGVDAKGLYIYREAWQKPVKPGGIAPETWSFLQLNMAAN